MDDEHPTRPAASTNPPQYPNPNDRPRRVWPMVVTSVLVIVLLIAGITHRRSKQAMAMGRYGANGPTMISTATAQTGSIGVYVQGLGIVTPVNTVAVEARVAGQITKVSYQEGQRVHVGDPLVDIDPRPYQAAVDQAQGQLEHDEALLQNAQTDLERYQEAMSKNAIPKQQYDTQLATVTEYKGSVKLDQANLTNAIVNLDYTHITSPLDGRVGLRLVDPGNIVQANGNTPLVIVAQLQPITVIFTVAEDDIPKIVPAFREQKSLPMEIYDHEDQTKIATGALQTIDNQINTATGTLKLRGICSNEDESLFPNQFVNVHLLVNTLQDITVLPNSVIQRNSDSAYVYLLKPPAEGQTNQTVEIQTVNVGATDGTVSQVDLDTGAIVAADNFNRLSDGAAVMIRPAGGRGQGQGREQGEGRSHKNVSQ